jgi:flagella synthesis protein FlgN
LTHSVCRELLVALSNERQAVHDFIALLQREQAMLTENDMEQLLGLAEQKSLKAVNLNALSDECRRHLEKISPALDHTVIESWLKINSKEGLAMWQEVRVLAGQAKQLNSVNGELIQMKSRYNQQAFAALSGAVNQANLYGANGQTNFSSGSGRSLGNG